MRRNASGDYRTLDGKYRVVKGWGHLEGAWAVLAINKRGEADILAEFSRLKDAREWLGFTHGAR